MRCIFCKSNSDHSVSVEHVIPESFGNKDYYLPPGWVCDSCNNYLALKVEKPFLDSAYGRGERFAMSIHNKRKRIPTVLGIHLGSVTTVEFFPEDQPGDGLSVAAGSLGDKSRFIENLLSSPTGKFIIPITDLPPNDYCTSRFIAKVAFEILVHRTLTSPYANGEIVDNEGLDSLRSYIRWGDSRRVWPISIRRIYPSAFLFQNVENSYYQLLNEWDIMSLIPNEYIVVVAMFGVEYAINLGAPNLETYQKWLATNNGRSFLHSKTA